MPELRIFSNKCNACGDCKRSCPAGALSVRDGVIHANRTVCTGCGDCMKTCPNQVLGIFGREMTPEEVFELILRDKDYYLASGGGVTIGGGEASQFPEFCLTLMALCRQNRISVAIDTCGYAPAAENLEVLYRADLLLYDLKGLDPVRHQAATGVDNRLILKNLELLNREGKELIIRIPVIPGYNDSDSELQSMARYLSRLQMVRRVDLICYHQFGMVKYDELERTYPMPDDVRPLVPSRQNEILRIFLSEGLPAQLGG